MLFAGMIQILAASVAALICFRVNSVTFMPHYHVDGDTTVLRNSVAENTRFRNPEN